MSSATLPAQGLSAPRGLRWSRDEWIARAMMLFAMALLLTFLIAPLFSILINAVLDKEGNFVGLAHFATYFQTPSLLRAAWNSVWVAFTVVLISVPTAFVCAYALTRTSLPGPFKATVRLIAIIPLLAPSLLSAMPSVRSGPVLSPGAPWSAGRS